MREEMCHPLPRSYVSCLLARYLDRIQKNVATTAWLQWSPSSQNTHEGESFLNWIIGDETWVNTYSPPLPMKCQNMIWKAVDEPHPWKSKLSSPWVRWCLQHFGAHKASFMKSIVYWAVFNCHSRALFQRITNLKKCVTQYIWKLDPSYNSWGIKKLLRLGLHIEIFSVSISGRFRRRSRSHWNKWNCIHELHCDLFSASFRWEWTTCPHKITVTCVNIGSRTTRIRQSCVHIPHRGTEFSLKMHLDKLNFLLLRIISRDEW